MKLILLSLITLNSSASIPSPEEVRLNLIKEKKCIPTWNMLCFVTQKISKNVVGMKCRDNILNNDLVLKTKKEADSSMLGRYDGMMKYTATKKVKMSNGFEVDVDFFEECSR